MANRRSKCNNSKISVKFFRLITIERSNKNNDELGQNFVWIAAPTFTVGIGEAIVALAMDVAADDCCVVLLVCV